MDNCDVFLTVAFSRLSKQIIEFAFESGNRVANGEAQDRIVTVNS